MVQLGSNSFIKKVERMQFLLTQLESVIGEEFLSTELETVLKEIKPMFHILIMGEVSSGKSSLISSLLHEQNINEFTSIQESNETSVPIYIRYADIPYIRAQFFTDEIIHEVEKEIKSLEINEDEHQGDIEYLKYIHDKLVNNKKIFRARGEQLGISEEINIDIRDRQSIFRQLKEVSASSSGNEELDAISKISFGYDNEFLRKTRNIEFIDCVGSGEPNPIISLKLDKVLKSNIDIVLFVFPDLSIKTSFTSLFNHTSTNKLIKEGRFVIVLNKLDQLGDRLYKASKKEELIGKFKKALLKNCPLIKDSINEIKFFTLSLHAIEGKLKNKWLVKESAPLKIFSIRQLNELREYFSESQYEIAKKTKRISAFKGQLQTLFQLFESLSDETESKVKKSESFRRIFESLIPEMEKVDGSLRQQKDKKGCFSIIEAKCHEFMSNIDWEKYTEMVSFQSMGNSKKLFREIRNFSNNLVKKIYDDHISQLYGIIMQEIEEKINAAFSEYVFKQDLLLQENLQQIISPDEDKDFRPFSASLMGQRELFWNTTSDPLAEANRKRDFEQYAYKYLSNCDWNTPRDAKLPYLRSLLSNNLKDCCHNYVKDYFLDGGEYYLRAEEYLNQTDRTLEDHLKMYQNTKKLYTSQIWIQRNRERIKSYSEELIHLAREADVLLQKYQASIQA
ncbi:MAG: GTPase domain-containing protein [Symploca sp. SIO1C2]|nr:GTPase domain-containing protein [Symploca sp. SIO1C2]